MKINAISEEFPLFNKYSNKSPIKTIKQEKPSIKMFTNIKNGFNNESPDFLRLDSMKENSHFYRNKFLSDIKTTDRSQFFKEDLNSVKEQIYHLKNIKENKSLSQNDKILRKIGSSYDTQLMKKRNNEINSKLNENLNICESSKNKRFFEIEKIPKINFKYKNVSLTSEDNSKFLKIKNYASSYLKMSNDYSIKEADNHDMSKYYIKEKLNTKSYDCINDTYTQRNSEKLLFMKHGDFFKK